MTRHSELWDCIREYLPKGKWTPLEEIYTLVKNNLALDEEDYEPQSPSSDISKWKRNVRNVLQYRKGIGEIDWDGQGMYQLSAIQG